jgi:protein-S-isoprenylcysteine O-methyltransferase Ste14
MRYLLAVIAFEALLAVLIFSAAGRIDLPWVWALLATHALLMALGFRAMDPDLRRERMRRRGGGIDRVFRSLILAFIVAHLVVAALDAGRFGWSPALPDGVRAAALLAYAAGVRLSMRAMAVNRFFAPAVRLQPERGQYAVTAGPYRFVRHPGYAGMLLAVFAECLVLASLWAALPALAFAAVLAARTAVEDRMLRHHLRGYADYALNVRYRLVPCVW